jgi:hypothetical protein
MRPVHKVDNSLRLIVMPRKSIARVDADPQ